MLVPSLRLGMPTRRLCLQFHIQAILPDSGEDLLPGFELPVEKINSKKLPTPLTE